MENLEPRLDRIESKQDQLLDKLETTNITLAAQHITLLEHSRRSLASEGRLDVVEAHIMRVTTIWHLLAYAGAFLVGAATIVGTIALFIRH